MPQSPRVTLGLAVSWILLNRSDEAQRLLEQLTARHPGFEPAYRALGECYEDAGNARRLIELGRRLQQINPRNPLGWYFEGTGLLNEGRTNPSSLGPSVATLRKSVQLGPSSARAHFVLARALQEVGDDDQAVAELKVTLRLEPDHERAHYVLARLYQKAADDERARLEFEKHKNLKEHDRNTQYRRILISIRDPEGEGL